MKMTKTEFKSLMKDCLKELINEGAFDKKLGQIAESKMRITSYSAEMANSQSPSGNGNNVPQRLHEVVKSISGAQGTSAKRSMYENILMDTAMTTLQKQINAEGGGDLGISLGVTQEDRHLNDMELNSLSGGNIGRWAAAAFAGTNKKV